MSEPLSIAVYGTGGPPRQEALRDAGVRWQQVINLRALDSGLYDLVAMPLGAVARIAERLLPLDIPEGPLDRWCRPEGPAVAVPWATRVQVLALRADDQLADLDAGSLEGFLEALQAAHRPERPALATALAPGAPGGLEFLPVLWGSGGQVLVDGGLALDRPEAVAALEHQVQRAALAHPDAERMRHPTPLEHLLAGDVAAATAWTDALPPDPAAAGLRLLPVPGVPVVEGTVLGVPITSSHPGPARALLEGLSQASGRRLSEHPAVHAALRTGRSPPVRPAWPALRALIGEAVWQAIRGVRSPAEALATLQRHATPILPLDTALDQAPTHLESVERLWELSSDMLLVAGWDGRPRRLNPAWEHTLGWTEEELRSRGLLDLIHPEDLPATRAAQQQVQSGDRLVDFRNRYRHRDGTWRWLAWSARSIPEDELTVAVIRDVTELVRARQELQQAHALLEQVFESLPQALFVIEGSSRTIRACNQAAERLFGWSTEELIGTTTNRLHVDQEHFERFASLGDPVLAQQGAFTTRYEMMRRDGTVFPTDHTVTLVRDDTGDWQYAVSLITDLSERVSLEEQLRTAQKMEAVGRLAGGVAHDFNNLLTIIDNHAALASTELDDPDAARADLATIRDATTRAARLTRQLLAFGRRQILQPEPLDVHGVLEDLRPVLDSVLGTSIELVTAWHATHPTVEADRGQIEQAFTNLVVNARDAMSEGGRLVLTTRDLAPDEAASLGLHPDHQAPAVLIEVRDEGQGMSATVQRQALEPFFSTRGGDHPGLGLATVYGIVKQSGGDLALESAPGEGTVVRIALPRVHRTAPPTPRPPQDSLPSFEAGASATVLLVEDEPAIRSLGKRLLSRGGWTVHTAASGQQALDRLDEEHLHVDLLVSDVVMPGMDGPTLARALRERFPALRVLLLSGYAAESLPHGVRDLDASFLPKPFSPRELIARVEAMLADRDRPGEE